MRKIDSQAAIESIGWKVVATTKHEKGMSFDAHRVIGKRALARGPVADTHDMAMLELYKVCLEK